MMHSLILSGLSNLADGGQFCADTRLVGSDGVSFRVHWPLLLARGVWWAKCVDQDQADGEDRVILIPENSRELRQFVDNLYCEYPCHGWSDVEIPQRRLIVETEDGEVVSRVYRSTVKVTGHAEAGTVPLGVVVTPTTTGDSDKAEVSSAVAANSDCITATFCEAELSVLALAHSLPAAADETAPGAGHPEAGTEDEVTSFVAANRDEAELTCPVPEWGSGHCLGVEA